MSDTTSLTAPLASAVITFGRRPISVEPVGDTDRPRTERRIRLTLGDISVYVSQPDAKLLAGELLAAAVRIEWESDFAAAAVPTALIDDVLGGSLRVAPDAA